MKVFYGAAALALSLALSAQAAWAGCNAEQVTAKGQEVTTAVQTITPKIGNGVDGNEYMEQSKKLQEAGDAISKEDFDKACGLYDEFLAWADKHK